jgi:hypothetical protein
VFFAAPLAAARADNLDAELIKRAPDVLRYLQGKGYQNVGVLPFQLQKGKERAGYGTAPISGNMATRLETALTMALDPSKPVGIIHKAGPVAASRSPQPHWSAGNAAQRAALFGVDYPLAWGGTRVKADAFLLGNVRLSPDMRSTTVMIACLDRQGNRVEPVQEFKIRTDRSVLADAGQSFVLSRSLVRKRSIEARDESSLEVLMDSDAADSAANRDEHHAGGGSGNEYVDFEVRYDGQPQPLSGDPADGGELRLTPPRPGQQIEFQFRNKTQDKIGVVVFVNGKSTLESMTEPPEMCRPWVLPPGGGPYGIRGYVDENNVLTPFKIVGKDDESVKNELAEKLGLIEVFVLAAGPDKGSSGPMTISGDTQDSSGEMTISRNLSLRDLSPGTRKRLGLTAAPKTAAEARDAAYRSRGLKPPPPPKRTKRSWSEGGYMVPDPQLREQIAVPVLDLPNRVLVSTPIIIRYNERAAN